MTTTSDDVPDGPEGLRELDEPGERPPARGLVLDEERGSLPYALVHGEPLVACAAWALGDAGVTLLDVGTDWEDVRDGDEPLVVQDALCPMTPPAFVVECVRRSVDEDVVVAGVRPVTDTVKVVHHDEAGATVGETVDREGLVAVASPVVLPPSVLRGLPHHPGTDLAALVSGLVADGVRVELLEAPPEGRRVTTEDEVRLLEALTSRR
jgi:2-C-methyl-D-erythritol 4-phosphate cytidylyltransferase